MNGHVDVAKVLIQNGVDVIAVDCEFKATALHLAVFKGHVGVAKVLIQNGADVNADVHAESFEEDKWTCLQFAARGGHVTLLLHLLAVMQGLIRKQSKTINWDYSNRSTTDWYRFEMAMA